MEERSKSATDSEQVTSDSVANEPTAVAQVSAEGIVTTGNNGDPDRTADAFVGRVVANRYKVTRRIGTGGFGAVFEAEDTKIRKKVAIKLLTRDLVTDPAILARFRQEAEAASKVGHPNIVDITDFDRTVDGHYFMVMEFLDGVDLGKLIRGGESISIARVLGIMIQVCRALSAAHDKGVIHRDLKPGNIYLTARGSQVDFVKLLDFGISKLMEVDEESARLTRTGQIIGTPLYMAPEQACGEENVDHRADVYSVGVIMYELITGQPPFTAVNYLGIIAQHASDPPVPPSKVREDLEIPPPVEAVILKAMEKRPEDRFSTVAEMEAALVQALATVDPSSAVTYAPDRTPPSLLTAQTGLSQRRLSAHMRMPLWTLIGVGALVGVVVAVLAAWPPGGSAAREDGGVAFDRGVGAPAVPDLAAMEPDSGAAPAERVTVRVVSKPAGATVHDGSSGETLCKTPCDLPLQRSDEPRGLVLRRRGYRKAALQVTPSADRTARVVLKKLYRGHLPDDPKGWGSR